MVSRCAPPFFISDVLDASFLMFVDTIRGEALFIAGCAVFVEFGHPSEGS